MKKRMYQLVSVNKDDGGFKVAVASHDKDIVVGEKLKLESSTINSHFCYEILEVDYDLELTEVERQEIAEDYELECLKEDMHKCIERNAANEIDDRFEEIVGKLSGNEYDVAMLYKEKRSINWMERMKDSLEEELDIVF